MRREAPSETAPATAANLAALAAAGLLERNRVSAALFPGECERLAAACKEMAERFSRGGRLLAFGRGHSATDAQHVSVEFVHPVIVGKRALPALDLSPMFRGWLSSLLRSDDMAMGFGPPAGDPEVAEALGFARSRGAQTFALPGDSGARAGAGGPESSHGPEGPLGLGGPAGFVGPDGNSDYALASPSPDPYIHQEMIEIVYHTLWETVHVYFEHRELGHEVGQSSFLYPYLGQRKQDTSGVLTEVAASILMKARDDERLRAEVAGSQAEPIARAAVAIRERLAAGGKLILFGNGGSATDANDWALDCASPRQGARPIPAVSLAMEPAILSALANDIGPEAIFLRQLIAHAGPHDVAVAISTSGGSANILAALTEAHRRGLLTVALLGYDGGETVRRGLADVPLVVPCDYIPRIQEVQASIYHVLLDLLGADDLGRAA